MGRGWGSCVTFLHRNAGEWGGRFDSLGRNRLRSVAGREVLGLLLGPRPGRLGMPTPEGAQRERKTETHMWQGGGERGGELRVVRGGSETASGDGA